MSICAVAGLCHAAAKLLVTGSAVLARADVE